MLNIPTSPLPPHTRTHADALARRFAWLSSPYVAKDAAKIMRENLKRPDLNVSGFPERVREIPDFEQHDAFHTLMEWLYGRLVDGF